MAGRVERGEIRLCRFPPPDKARPVLILTRSSAIGYLSRVTIAPITSTIRGVPSEVAIGEEDGMKRPCAVNLHNVVTIAKDRIGRRTAQLGDERMREVCRALDFALGCDL
jgi:mRNA interferase MazF